MAPNVAKGFSPLVVSVDEMDNDALDKILDSKSDTNGLSKFEGEDWTDVKNSERKKRDRILDNGVVLKLIQKSDYEGFKRLFTNLSILAATAYLIHRLEIFPFDQVILEHPGKIAMFFPLYVFYGFQFQCFAFAGQHEFLHRNAWKTKWINDAVLFIVGTVCFEFGTHERVMHKQHHTYTNNIDKDPELTSYYSREELENPMFRNVSSSRYAFFKAFIDVTFPLRCRLLRLINSARGKPVDYSGMGWSMQTETYSKESGIMKELQVFAILQLLCYVVVFGTIGQTSLGRQQLLFWWLIPVIIGYPPVNYVRNLEHADCEVSKSPNMLRNTRTCESYFIIRLLLWETNFHAEHHCYPMVPFFNLPKLHALMNDHVLHNECKNFTSTNWNAIKNGGWIDKQNSTVSHDKSE